LGEKRVALIEQEGLENGGRRRHGHFIR
jgi:hypothetical protein